MYAYALTHPACQPPDRIAGDVPPFTEIFLTSADGVRLRAWYYPTNNGAVILALGGMQGSLGDRLPEVAFLLKQGFGVLQVDSRACAQPPAVVTLGGKEVLDAMAALDFLRGQPEVNRIGVMGFSMGGVTAIRAAARHSEIAAVLAEGGYYNLGDDILDSDRPVPMLKRYLLWNVAMSYWLQTGVNPWQVCPLDDLPRISPRPVYLIYGEYESSSGRAEQQFSSARPPKTLWLVPGGDHGRNHLVAPSEYQRNVINFFKNLY